MPLRKKLILSNIIVFIVPIIFGMIILSLLFQNFNMQFGLDNSYGQLQKLFSSFSEGNANRFDSAIQELEEKGYQISFESKNSFSYKTADFDKNYKLFVEDINYSEDVTEYTVVSSRGAIYYFAFTDNQNKAAVKIITDKPINIYTYSHSFLNMGFDYMRKMVQIAFLGIIGAVAVTISILTYLISRSILKPLRLLKEGTYQIKTGNLNHSIVYQKNDEFGDVCADFEDMRISLLTLKQEERRYEENRKELIAGITHDLNTPLTSIKGFVSGLLEGITNTPEKQKTYLQRINQTADRMSGLIEELLLYSTLDMDGVSFTFERIDLVEYFKDCLLEMKEEFKQKDVCLHFEPVCQEAYADIDIMRFNRVILNILGNSVKYKKDGYGNIYIKVNKIHGKISISISDDGLGIPESESYDIFNVFYRADKSRSSSVGGNGLGLAIVQRIVTAHGGSVRASPDTSGGLKVTILLPESKTREGETDETNTDS